MRFVNESYESKSSEWKLWYRAGKEPVPAARAAVGAWLKELGRQAIGRRPVFPGTTSGAFEHGGEMSKDGWR